MKKNTFIVLLFLVLSAIAVYLYYSQKNTTIRKELSDFAVEDTASVTKIFLADNNGKKITLERINSTEWNLNGKYAAREDAVNVLLTTIKRVAVKAPVPKPAFENVLKQIAAQHVKIEIYQSDDEPVKVYYVGHSNQEHSGTYMLLDKSSVPFLVHIEGFRGFLTPRYFINENEWRSTVLFEYNYGEIASVKIEYTTQPEKSFVITENGNNLFDIKPVVKDTEESRNYDTAKVLQYVALFQKIHFEGFEETKTQPFKDSITNTTPLQIYTVTDKTGIVKTLKTFPKPAHEGATDPEGKNPIINDLDRFYGLVNDTDFVIIQYFVFDPITKEYGDFIPFNELLIIRSELK